MAKYFIVLALLAGGWRAAAAERVFDFRTMTENQPPPGLRSTVAGEGRPGDWRVILDEVPPTLAPLTADAPVVTKQAVLAQLAQDPTDEHFPLLIDEGDVFTDFTLTTRFKIVRGTAEEMAGVAFRLQDEKNFYVIRASALGNNIRFYKVVNGERSAPIGPEVRMPTNAWQELMIECKGNQIHCRLNGAEVFPTLEDNTFMRGKVAFWTKSDSVSYFADTKISYVPQVVPVQAMVRAILKEYPRLVGLKVFARTGQPATLKVIASNDAKDVGQPGGADEQDVVQQGTVYCGKAESTLAVLMPLRDRNGDVIAAVRVTLKSFPGQTEQNAIARARPIVRRLQDRVQTAQDLFE